MRIGFIVDSTGYLEPEVLEKHDISMVPLKYTLDDVNYVESMPGEPEFDRFYDRLKTSKGFPKTASPSIGEFVEVYESKLKKYDHLIVVTISSKISATFDVANMAANLLGGDKVSVINSYGAAACLRFIIELGITLSEQGLPVDEVVAKLRERACSMGVSIVVDDMEYVARGGRLPAIVAKAGNALGIKPVIVLKEGGLTLGRLIRGRVKSLQHLVQSIPQDACRVSISHIRALEEAKKLYGEISRRFQNAKVTFEQVGAVVGSHLGPKAIGVLYCSK